jgi:hypothetical protein
MSAMAFGISTTNRLTAFVVFSGAAARFFQPKVSGTHYVTPRALTVELGFHF